MTSEQEKAGMAMGRMLRRVVVMMVEQQDAARVVVGTGRLDGVMQLNVFVAPCDLGKLIGDGGQTAKALFCIVGAAAKKHGVRCELEIREE